METMFVLTEAELDAVSGGATITSSIDVTASGDNAAIKGSTELSTTPTSFAGAVAVSTTGSSTSGTITLEGSL